MALDLRHGAAPARRRRLGDLQHRARSTTSASALGVRFVDTTRGPGKRPVREIDGVDADAVSNGGHTAAATSRTAPANSPREFTVKHGRPPTAKRVARAGAAREPGDPRGQARAAVGGRAAGDVAGRGRPGAGVSAACEHMIGAALQPELDDRARSVSQQWLEEAAEPSDRRARGTPRDLAVLAPVRRGAAPGARRSTYRPSRSPRSSSDLVDAVTDQADQPDARPRPDRRAPRSCDAPTATSVYRHTGADHFTSQRMLDAEQRIVDAAGRTSAATIDPVDVELALMKAEPRRSRAQRGPARAGARHGQRPAGGVQLALAPAGSGKTTAMRVLADVCDDLGYDRHRARPVGGGRGGPRRGDRDADRDARQARPRPSPPARIPASDRTPCRDRRGRHGRHPHPRPSHRRLLRPRRPGAADRRRPAARRDRRRRRPARHRQHARRRTTRRRSSGSPTPSRQPRPSPCGTATEPRSGSTSTTTASTAGDVDTCLDRGPRRLGGRTRRLAATA